MKYRLFRVVAECLDDHLDDGDRLTFDVFVDQNNTAFHRGLTFGFMGSVGDTTVRFLPFGIKRDGRLANLTNDEPDCTEEYIKIFGKRMQVGEFITYVEDDAEYTYRIVKAFDLLEVVQ